jgi:hypothetical protein
VRAPKDRVPAIAAPPQVQLQLLQGHSHRWNSICVYLEHAVLLRCLRWQERKASVVGCIALATSEHCNIHERVEIVRCRVSRRSRVSFLPAAQLQGLEVQEWTCCRYRRMRVVLSGFGAAICISAKSRLASHDAADTGKTSPQSAAVA